MTTAAEKDDPALRGPSAEELREEGEKIRRERGISPDLVKMAEAEIRRRDRLAVWRAAGLGFWRLAWIVALGILLAQGIVAAILWAVASLKV